MLSIMSSLRLSIRCLNVGFYSQQDNWCNSLLTSFSTWRCRDQVANLLQQSLLMQRCWCHLEEKKLSYGDPPEEQCSFMLSEYLQLELWWVIIQKKKKCPWFFSQLNTVPSCHMISYPQILLEILYHVPQSMKVWFSPNFFYIIINL